jgi:hypothetical protein
MPSIRHYQAIATSKPWLRAKILINGTTAIPQINSNTINAPNIKGVLARSDIVVGIGEK